MIDQETSISSRLYKDYYLTDKTPGQLVSSHWKAIHERSEVDVSPQGIEKFKFELGDYGYSKPHHKFLNWATIVLYLFRLENKNDIVWVLRKAIPLARRMKFPFTYDCFRQVCTAALLSRYIIASDRKFKVINIGDGYGFLSALIKELFPNAQLYLVDLGKTLLFQSYYCAKGFSDKDHYLVSRESTRMGIDTAADFVYCSTEDLALLDDVSFDAAINVASMQEMNTETIRYYFQFLRGHMVPNNLFYCCNRLEKYLAGGEVTRFLSYPWDERDRVLIDEPCPWQRFYLSFHRTERGPKFFNRRVPLIAYYDGDMHHRLSTLHVLKG